MMVAFTYTTVFCLGLIILDSYSEAHGGPPFDELHPPPLPPPLHGKSFTVIKKIVHHPNSIHHPPPHFKRPPPKWRSWPQFHLPPPPPPPPPPKWFSHIPHHIEAEPIHVDDEPIHIEDQSIHHSQPHVVWAVPPTHQPSIVIKQIFQQEPREKQLAISFVKKPKPSLLDLLKSKLGKLF